jgi:integrase
MGLVVKHILRHASGRVSYRRVYPPELRPFLSGREHKVSLGREGEPGFLSRYEAADTGYAALVARARRQHEGAYDALDAPRVAYLKEVFRVELLQEDDAARWDPTERELYRSVAAGLEANGIAGVMPWRGRERERWAAKARQTLDETLPLYRHLRATGDTDGILATWSEAALDLLEAEGLAIAPDALEAVQRLCRALNDAAIEAGDLKLQRLDGADVPTPPEPVKPIWEGPVGKRPASVPILATFDAYAKAQNMTPGVRQDLRRNMERLVEFLGHDDARSITTDDLIRWKDALAEELTVKGRKRDPLTIKGKYIGAVKAMLKWAVEERKLPSNVAAAVVVRVPKKVKLRERSFTTEEATKILSATLDPITTRMADGHKLARRWIPWLCAYTGARVNEFSQLRAEDVQKIEGIWAVRITPEAGTVKAKTARVVPLHPDLIEQGFLDVVKARGTGPLFYDPTRQRVAKEGNRHFKKVGEKIAEWVRNEVGVSDPAVQPNHGWRHLFKSMSYAVGIEERMADAIQGHAPTTTGRTYGDPPLRAKAEAIARLPFFEVRREGTRE